MFHRWAALALVLALWCLAPESAAGQSAQSDQQPRGRKSGTLGQNYPNPFNPETAIRYSVGSPGAVTIRIFNAAGALVRKLVDRPHASGDYTVRWNGTDDHGRRLSSGVYFYEIQLSSGFRDSRKLVLLK